MMKHSVLIAIVVLFPMLHVELCAAKRVFQYTVVNELAQFPPVFNETVTLRIRRKEPMIFYMPVAANEIGGVFDKFEMKYFASVPGYFITSINGVVGNLADSTYWQILVNGAASDLGVSAYKPGAGDHVVFKFIQSGGIRSPDENIRIYELKINLEKPSSLSKCR